jgi:molybdopterin converting factor small subunit
VVLANVSGMAFAEGAVSFSGTAGITPDSVLYGVDTVLDDIKISLTFNGASKVEAITDVAEERLGESEVMVEEGKEDLAKTAIEEYSENMEIANEILQQIIQAAEGEEVIPETEATIEEAVQNTEQEGTVLENPTVVEENTSTENTTPAEETTGVEETNDNTTETTTTEENTPVEESTGTEENTNVDETTTEEDTTEESTEEVVTEEDVQVDEEQNEELKALEAKIVERHQKSIEVLKVIQEKVSDEAKETIATVIEMQTVRQEAVIAMVEKRSEFNSIKTEVEDALAKLEEAKTSGDEVAIKAAEELVDASKEKFFELKDEFKEAFKNNIVVNKAVKEVKKELKKELKDEVKAGNVTKEEAKEAVKSIKTNNGQGVVNRIKDKVEDIKDEVEEVETAKVKVEVETKAVEETKVKSEKEQKVKKEVKEKQENGKEKSKEAQEKDKQ